MTDEAKELVANMRDTIREWERDEPRDDWFLHQHDFAEAADLIETQAREIERLRGALKRWQYSGCPDCGGDCGSANPPVICCIMEETRAALAGDSHDQ